ncbi:hypothetical protein ACQJBY_016394 [Aegilops geniculata]
MVQLPIHRPNADAAALPRRAVVFLFSHAGASRRISNTCNGASWPSVARALAAAPAS